jgi:HKD family nuclease
LEVILKILFSDNQDLNVGDVIKNSFNKAIDIKIAVAFLKQSGINVIKEDLNNCLKNNGKVEFLVGLDFRSTDPESLITLRKISDSNRSMKCYCFSDPGLNNAPIFHPKLYLISDNLKNSTAIVGSSNLTQGGLKNNIEINVIFQGRENDNAILQLTNIYLKMRLQETIFEPSYEYLEGYKEIYDRISKSEKNSFKHSEIKKVISKLKEIEEILPGTRPTLRRLAIDAVKTLPKDVDGFVNLKDIYSYVKSQYDKIGIPYDNVRDINANIRRAIYGDLIGWKGKYNRGLFERKSVYSGLFRLTKEGEKAVGR